MAPTPRPVPRPPTRSERPRDAPVADGEDAGADDRHGDEQAEEVSGTL